MATGTAGTAARQYHTQQVHYLRKSITYANTSATTVGIIPAGSLIHKAMSGVHVTTAFNDSGTDLVDVGTSADGDLFATDLDVSSVGFKVIDEDIAGLLVAADTTVTVTYAGQNSNASAGAAEVIIAYIPDNDG